MSAPLRAKKSNKTIVWILLGLLVISLTGFGVSSVGSSSNQAVATVGTEKVTVVEYSRALNQQMRALSQRFGTNLTFEQARLFGVDRMVLTNVIGTAALNGETTRVGLSAGDQQVLKQLLATQAFLDLTGKFDQQAYEEALRSANLKPAEYDEMIRSDIARSMLQIAVAGGVQANDDYALALLDYVGETRDFLWVELTADNLAEPVRQPDESEIEAAYKADPERYTAPETRKITYAELLADTMAAKLEVSDEDLQKAYDQEIDRFVVPSRRMVERLVYPDQAAAEAALGRMASGDVTFDDLVAERGLTLDDIDMGEVAQKDLSAAAAEAVFALTEPGIAGPVESSLGPAIFRVNAVLDEQVTTFEDARDELRGELVADRARRAIDGMVNDIDDLLAAGATLEELAGETDMELGTIDYSPGSTDGIAAHEEFRTAAEAAKPGDFPQIVTLADGGIFALRLDEIVPPTLIPLDEARDRVVADWQAAETHRQLVEMADTVRDRLALGDTFEMHALTPKAETQLRRDAFVDDAPQSLVSEAYKLARHGAAVVDGGSRVALVRVTGIAPFDPAEPQNAEILKSVGARYSGDLGSEIFDAFVTALQDSAGITVNQALINAIHAQMP
jgi:peptidyl-prolyl cis-trans isomerase D